VAGEDTDKKVIKCAAIIRNYEIMKNTFSSVLFSYYYPISDDEKCIVRVSFKSGPAQLSFTFICGH
jgi:hypothetical protein